MQSFTQHSQTFDLTIISSYTDSKILTFYFPTPFFLLGHLPLLQFFNQKNPLLHY